MGHTYQVTSIFDQQFCGFCADIKTNRQTAYAKNNTCSQHAKTRRNRLCCTNTAYWLRCILPKAQKMVWEFSNTNLSPGKLTKFPKKRLIFRGHNKPTTGCTAVILTYRNADAVMFCFKYLFQKRLPLTLLTVSSTIHWSDELCVVKAFVVLHFTMHRMHEMQPIVTDARGMCLSVTRWTRLYCAKTAKQIKILFGVNTLGAPRNIGSCSPQQRGEGDSMQLSPNYFGLVLYPHTLFCYVLCATNVDAKDYAVVKKVGSKGYLSLLAVVEY